MTIKEITIRVQASKNYQVYENSFTAENISETDLELLRNTAIMQAKIGIDALVDSTGATSETNVKSKARVITNETTTTSQMPPKTDDLPFTFGPASTQPQSTQPQTTPEIGMTRLLPNNNSEFTTYKLCKNKSNGELFFALVDHNDEARGFKKYVKYTPGM